MQIVVFAFCYNETNHTRRNYFLIEQSRNGREREMNIMELEEIKGKIQLLDYIKNHTTGKVESVGENKYRLNPCPICNGKDHFTIYSNSNSYSSFSQCCKGGSIVDYLIEVEHMEQSQAISKLYEMVGIPRNSIKGVSQTVQSSKISKEDFIRQQKRNFIVNGINRQTESNKQEVYTYLEKRGISSNMANKYHLFISNEVYEDKGTPRLVIPITKNGEPVSYVARAIIEVESRKKAVNSAGEQTLLNIDYLKQKGNDLIYICEGWADALSIEDTENKAIALHSTQNTNKLIKAIQESKETAEKKTYMLCYDNDTAGETAQNNLIEKLTELGINYNIVNIPKTYKDINEWYKADKEGFKVGIKPFANDTVYTYIHNTFLTDINKMKSYQGKKTGFENLDNELKGINPGLYVLGAISSLGKTTFIHQIADNMAQNGEHILFFSLEQSKFELVSKSISRETFKIAPREAKTNLNIMQGRSLNDDIFKEAVSKYQETAKNMTIIEGNFDMNVKRIRNYVETYIKTTGTRPIVIIDYLQILRPIEDKWSEKQQTDFNVSELKRISRDNDITIIAISSFNRENYSQQADFTSFKESGAIEYGADVVMALQLSIIEAFDKNTKAIEIREKINEAKGEIPRNVTLVCLKNRNGKSYFKCRYKFYASGNTFLEAGE